ncbi:MAG TPA: FAD-dependent oxidoreductase [Candidatus Obscuribacter sp.]|nr:FAD-dependent oxidoreductase [Candidatus Obscuribacter sp.]
MADQQFVVIGAGIIGLTTARVLQQAGHRVQIISAELPLDTTSVAAAAFWYPSDSEPKDDVLRWGLSTLKTFKELKEEGVAGITYERALEVHPDPTWHPWWLNVVANPRKADLAELPPPVAGGSGYWFDTLVIDTTVMLKWLMEQFSAAGGAFVQQKLNNITEIASQTEIIVNCSGVGARDLVGDSELYATRGQTLKIRRKPEHRAVWEMSTKPLVTHIIPREADTVIGGVFQEHNYSRFVDPLDTEGILQRCRNLQPTLGTLNESDILSVSVGLRPTRARLRLESEKLLSGSTVIHNYGHGSCGWSLSWGCAEAVRGQVQGMLPL